MLQRLMAAAFVLIASQALAQAQSGREIVQSWVGKKLKAVNAAGVPLDLMFQADGNAQWSAADRNDRGKWRLTDDGYCVTWQTANQGREVCLAVERRGGSVVTVNKATGAVTSTIMP